jgi:predicted transcriptional regulator
LKLVFMKKNIENDKLLTDTELELMTILWKLGEGSVADVIENLSEGRELAYTSVSTILRILEQKQVLKTRKEGKGHIYIPTLQRDEYEKKAVKNVVDKVFDGTPSLLVKQLLDTSRLSEEELKEIKSLLLKKENKK